MSNGNYENRESFLNEIKVDDNKQRLFALKRKLDDGEIEVEDLSKKDIESLIELYDLEVKSIKDDTNKIRDRIKKELQELKKYRAN